MKDLQNDTYIWTTTLLNRFLPHTEEGGGEAVQPQPLSGRTQHNNTDKLKQRGKIKNNKSRSTGEEEEVLMCSFLLSEHSGAGACYLSLLLPFRKECEKV